VLDALPPPMAKVLRLLDQTGMRENEAVILSAGDLDHARKQIMLLRTKTNRSRTLDWVTPGGDATAPLAAGKRRVSCSRPGAALCYANFASDFGNFMRRMAAAEKKANRPFRHVPGASPTAPVRHPLAEKTAAASSYRSV
jgi:integrase/recombinase XerD